MKTKFVFASFVAALSGLAGLATPAIASPDVYGPLNKATSCPPAVVVVSGRGSDRCETRVVQSDFNRGNARSGPYGPDWYAQQEELRRRRNGQPDFRVPSSPRGYWKDVVVKQVIPGHWEIVGYDRFGREIRNYQPTHVEFRTERVWVDGRG